MAERFIDRFVADLFTPKRCEALDNLQRATQRLAVLQYPLTHEQREESARVARERGWLGPMPWEPGYVKGSQAKLRGE